MVLRIVTFKIDESLLEELDAYAREHRISRSEAIRKAIEEFLRNKDRRRYDPKIIRVKG